MKNAFTFSKQSYFSLMLILSFLVFKAEEAKSCIDSTTVITVTANYNAEFTEVEIRLGNLLFMTEEPNVFCSCALSNYTDFFTYLDYVAFVETGTNMVYPNMAPWESTQAVDDAWDAAQPGFGNWEGFIAEVINGGLGPNDDVELVIRASTPPGLFVEVSQLDSVLSFSYLGTDAWDPAVEDLFADHQSVRNLSGATYNEVSDEYFVNLDNAIMTNVDDVKNSLPFSVSPNPFEDVFYLNYFLEYTSSVTINLYNITGQLVYSQTDDSSPTSESIRIEAPDGLLQKGMYLVEIVSDRERGVQKVLRN